MVVSEMGEQWSPQTAPARQADMLMTPMVLPTGKMLSTMGIRIPKVPQEVPVANAMAHAIRRMIAGRKLLRASAEPKALFTKVPESKSAVMFLRVVAIVRMRMAGTMAIKPLGMHSMASLNVTSLLATK